MIRHTVAFSLKHAKGSPEETSFLKEALALADIASVKNFEQLRQVSAKCKMAFGFSMEFDDEAGYAAYNSDPRHVAFVRKRWDTEVTSFQEIDYAPL